ncbi:MAG: hypothetical protein O6952_05735 [Planctomycetota bacterium]|nr:hypothetical protein [Planctomycetota bacterium]
MAAVTTIRNDFFTDKSHRHTMTLTTADPISDAIAMIGSADRSIQSEGTFAGGSVVTVEGSNDGGVTWAPLNDHFGTAIAQAAAGLDGIAEIADMIRARLNPIGAAATINVTIVMRRQT